uniref:CD22 molecule n=1 Tax=Pipistrellus kuhlii TaxID=59472 RepID=A0A7J7UZP5_PIPKU|nr:CD22 molecule [Pipistrellus kuhlii]
MHLLGPLFLLLEYLASSNSHLWKVEHPAILYAWEGACVWIPCHCVIPGMVLENLTVYHNYVYDDKTKNYNGTILYEKIKSQVRVSQERVKFLGDEKSNCTLHIDPVKAQDSGQLGLLMTAKNERWMENIVLNVSNQIAVVPARVISTFPCPLDFPDHPDYLHPEQAHLPATMDSPWQESDLPGLE